MSAKTNSWRESLQLKGKLSRWRLWLAIGVAAMVLVGASFIVSMPQHSTRASGGENGTASSGQSPSSSTALGKSASSANQGANSGLGNAGSSTHSAGFTGSAHTSASAATTSSSASTSSTQVSSSSAQSSNGPAGSNVKDVGVAASLQSSQQRMVIESADLQLKVSDLGQVDSQISSLTTGNGGFIQTMHQSTDGQGQNLETISVRIPENQFSSVLADIKGLGTVDSFSQSGQDVTTQHNNLQQQIDELQNEATAYTRLFDKAKTMADMLQIQQSLTRVNGQISDLNTQLHQLNHSVQYATLNVTLRGDAVAAATPKNHTEQPLWMLTLRSLHGMERIGMGIGKILAWMLPWLVLSGMVYGGIRLLRRLRHGKASS